MATAKFSITYKNATDLLFNTTTNGRTNIRRLINFLGALVGGMKEGSNFSVWTTAVKATGTVTLTSCAAGNVILINNIPFTAVSGTAVVANGEFKVGVTDTADAASLVAAINGSTNAAISGVLTATSALGVVTLTAVDFGLSGNAITIDNLGIVATGTITLASALANDTVTINGKVLTAKTASPTTDQWLVGVSDTADAAALATLINAETDVLLLGFVRATSAAAVVTVYSQLGSLNGNTVTLASSNGGRLAVSGARLTGGTITQFEGVAASGTVTIASGSGATAAVINGVSISVTWATSDTATATALAAAIQASANALIRGLVYASSAAGVVTITATRGGPIGNSITLAGTGTGVTASGANLASGAVPTQAVFSGLLPRYGLSNGGALTSGSNDALLSQGIQTV